MRKKYYLKNNGRWIYKIKKTNTKMAANENVKYKVYGISIAKIQHLKTTTTTTTTKHKIYLFAKLRLQDYSDQRNLGAKIISLNLLQTVLIVKYFLFIKNPTKFKKVIVTNTCVICIHIIFLIILRYTIYSSYVEIEH